jgi:hypothetical protein
MSSKKISYLSGPVSWYEYEFMDDKGNKKMIHLFGDRHDHKTPCDASLKCRKNSESPESECYDFIFFLKELFDIIVKNQNYADLFLEFPYNIYRENIYTINQTSMIAKIYNQFKECFQFSKKECKYNPYVRMHYTDLRFPFDTKSGGGVSQLEHSNDIFFFKLIGKLILDLSEEIRHLGYGGPTSIKDQTDFDKKINMINLLLELVLNDYCKFYQILLRSDNFQNEFLELIQPIQNLFEMDNSEDMFKKEEIGYFNDAVKQILKFKHPKSNSSIIRRQALELYNDNITVNGENIADLIYSFIIPKCEENISIFKKILIDWQKIIEHISNFFTLNINERRKLHIITSEFLKLLNSYFVHLEAFILDSYILPRLFRTFSSSKSLHHPSVLSIIYAGDNHINIEVEFFEKILKLTPKNKSTKETVIVNKKPLLKQCIHAQGINFRDIMNYFQDKQYKVEQPEPEEIVEDELLINEKYFDIIHKDKDGILLQGKDLGQLCMLVPNIEICYDEENVLKPSDHYVWIDKKEDNKKYIFNFSEEMYKYEDNEDIELEDLQQLRKTFPTSQLFQNHENELLNPSNREEQMKYIKRPKLQPQKLYNYATDVIGGEWKEAEDIIFKDKEYKTKYEKFIHKLHS